VMHDAGKHERGRDVENRADDERDEDAAGHVLLGIARLLRRRRHGVEPNAGDEDHAGAAQHAAPTVLAEGAGVRRHEGMPVAGVDVLDAEGDEQDEHEHLDDDDHRVEFGRLANAHDEDRRNSQHDERRRHVEQPRDRAPVGQRDDRAGRAGERCRNLNAKILKKAHHVARTPDGNRRGAEGVLENQVPADDPGEQLAERGVRVGVRAPGHGNHRRELGVAESRERAANRGDQHREDQRRPGELRRRRARDDEDPGTDDGAEAESRETERAEGAAKGASLGFGDEVRDGLACHEAHANTMTRRRAGRVRRQCAPCQRLVRGARPLCRPALPATCARRQILVCCRAFARQPDPSRASCCSRRCSPARSPWRRCLPTRRTRPRNRTAQPPSTRCTTTQPSRLGSSSPATTPYELLPAPTVLASTAAGVLRCPDATGDSARSYFRLDFRDGSLATAGPALAAATRQWIVDTITSHSGGVYQPDWSYAIVVGGPSGESSAIGYAVKYAEHHAPIAAYGVRTCADAVGPALIRDIVAHRALLPASVSGAASNDSVVALQVRDAKGRTVYESGSVAASPYSAEAPLVQAGGLTVQATIRPRALELLALGALPQSHVPLLVGLLTLTAAMIVVTVLQLRRDQELSRLRADFISSVSHELRTPLSQILLFAETLNLGRVRSEEERRTAANVIVQEGRRLMHLVENILHFSRAERRMTRLG